MGVLVHMHDRFDPRKRGVYPLARPVTVRRLVQSHRALRAHTRVYRPGGIYGRRKVREFTRATVCLLNGAPLPRKEWKRAVVGPSDVVAFFMPPAGGDGLRIVASLVLIALATLATSYAGGWGGPAVAQALAVSEATGAAIATTAAVVAVAAVGYGVMSLFVDQAAPTNGTGFAGETPASSPVYNLTAQGNYARLQQAIPEAFGHNRLFPDFVTTPYATYDDAAAVVNSSTTQHLHHILGLGIGEFEIDVDSLKLGDTPLASYPDIEWAIIEPGDYPDTAIADERWIVATDLADVELLAANESPASQWGGPFAATPPQTTIGHIAVDITAPRGLWKFNPVSTAIDGLYVTYEIEAQLIDDEGAATGAWETFAPVTLIRTSQDPQRWTSSITLPSTGRWQVRVRRTDNKELGLQAGHQLDWTGLRGRIVGRRKFVGMTCIQLKMKAGSALNAAQARQVNLEATRKLPTWDGSAMTTAIAATRDPCDAFAYIARAQNGGRLRDDQVALADLYANKAALAANGWTFDFVFDGQVTISEALGRVSRAVVAERVVQGGQLRLVRDIPVTAPVAMFSPRNIAPGSLSIEYVITDSTSPDCLIGEYIDQTTWLPREVTVAFDDSAQARPTRMTLHGVGTRDQGRAVLWNLARGNRYRRRVLAFTTPMEGLAVTFGDGISFSHDVPSYGQTLEVIDYDDTDPNHPVLTFVDAPDFSPGAVAYYAAVRDSVGRRAGPFRAHRHVDPYKMKLDVPDPDELPDILTGGDRERTWLQFGVGENYSKPLKIKQVTPRDAMSADLVAFDDDPRMYAALPDEPEVPIGVPTDPLFVPIHNSDGPIVDLRWMANDNDYSGLVEQEVTFTLASDVDVQIVRGSWPLGAVPVLELAGAVSGITGTIGVGGAGGTPVPAFADVGNGYPGTAGGAGNTALDSSTGPLVITGAGTIRGGKGGGGGGGGGGGAFYEIFDGGVLIGHQLPGGVGGAGNGSPGGSGTTEGGVSAGAGGNGGAIGSTWATAGTAGLDGAGGDGLWGTVGPSTGGLGAPGGAAGKAIVGASNLDLTGFYGTIIGEAGGAVPSPPPGDADAMAWKAAVVAAGGSVSDAQLGYVSTLIASLKSSGVWPLLDRLWLFASENPAQALRDIKSLATATAVNTPTFTALRGYAGNGSTSYVNTGFNLSAGTNFTRNSAHVAEWRRTAGTSGTARASGCLDATATSGTYMQTNGASRIQVNGAFNVDMDMFDEQVGLLAASRTTAGAAMSYVNGVLQHTNASNASFAPISANYFVGTRNYDGGLNQSHDAQTMALSLGAGLTGPLSLALYNALNAYKTSVGA